jgi:multiple sugar transport system permease protein
MPILNRIQQRSASGRLLIALIYGVLSLGAATMVYPFLLMLSGSVKSEIDMQQLDIVPRFLHDELALFQKFEEQRYVKLDAFNIATGYRDARDRPLYAFDQLSLPTDTPSGLVDLWEQFLESERNAPVWERSLGHFAGHRTVAEIQLRFQREILARHPEVERKEVMGLTSIELWGERTYQPMSGRFGEVYSQLRDRLPERYFYPTSVRGQFLTYFLPQLFSPDDAGLRALNASWGTSYARFSDIPFPDRAPENPAARAAWWSFVQNSLSGRFLHLDASLADAYRAFLETKFGFIDRYNALAESRFGTWSEIPFPGPRRTAFETANLEEFVKGRDGPEGLSVQALEFRWTDFLRAGYPTIEALNQALGTAYVSFPEVPMPVLAFDYAILKRHRGEILWELLTRNYRVAWNEVVVQGNGLRNTVIFCLLNVLTALIINPLAAYALSRFQPSWGQKALFFLMATMAFPAEVTQIPSFLLLRDLGWLNTFAALVIPAAANGYSIFLLKGFFDSLPQELYEAANIDGCGEVRAFLQITVPLSAPILAVVALGAFTSAYGAFMFALLVCQQESMWTLMVYIYQIQQAYAQPIVFAALIIAAIPTLIVFLTCQNVIMRGIVVPVEK